MSTLLPPNVVGPVSEISTSVRIDGPLSGASVELLINGVSAVTVNAGGTTTFVPVALGTLKAGDLLTARWSLNGEISDPTPVATGVIGLPTTLAPLSFLSLVHECIDWVVIGGCYPGASVELFNGATPIGSAVASDSQTTVAVNVRGTISTNDVLHATQFIQPPAVSVKSPSTPSLPAEPTPFQENAMPMLSIGAVPDCAWSVPIYGIAQGASTHLNYNGDIVRYAFVGTSFRANIGRQAHRPDTFTATQHFERCNAASSPPTPVVVDTKLPVRTPTINTYAINCAAARAINIGNLEPGAVLTIQIVQPSGAATEIGHIGVGEGVHATQIWLPDLTAQIPPAPPDPSLIVIQEFCGKSATSDKVILSSTYQGSIYPPTILGPLVECAGGVLVNSVDSAVVRLYSDAPDTPIISNPVFSWGGIVWVPTYRPLRAGERITAKLELTCQPPDRRIGPTVQVAGLPDLTPPKIREPIRVFYRSVFIDNVVPGANVHVFINGKWRAQELVKQYGGFVYVDVGTLKVEDKITAVQALCTKFSPHSSSVNVVPGKMLLSVQPASLVQGQAASLKITAGDAESPTFPVAATVSLGGSVIGATNVPFTITAPVGAPTVNLLVTANGYNTETLSIPLTSQVVVKPAMLTIITSLSFNASKKVINEITWNLLGPSASFSKNEKPNINPASVQFALPPPPGGGFTSFTLSGLVSFEYENFNFISGANGKGTSNFIQGGFIKPSPSTLGLQWNGSDMTINLLVDWINATDEFIIQVF